MQVLRTLTDKNCIIDDFMLDICLNITYAGKCSILSAQMIRCAAIWHGNRTRCVYTETKGVSRAIHY